MNISSESGVSKLNTSTYINAKNNGINGDGTTDIRAKLNTLISNTSSAGGGVIYCPAGTYIVSGDGTPSNGAVLLQDNVFITGDGLGATIFKMADDQTADVTGIFRTPSAAVTINTGIGKLTVDGNRANQTTISITLTQTGGTATATVASADRPAVGDEIYILGANQTEYNGYAKVLTTPLSTTFTFAVDSGAVSPATGTITYGFAIDGFFCGTSPGSALEDNNILLDHVEIKECTRYGSDPHEQTRNLVHNNCKSHDNGLDGFVSDFIEDGQWNNCEAYDNDRHGFNVTTRSSNCQLVKCDAYDNTSNGIVIQRGSDNLNAPFKIALTDCNVYSNTMENMVIRMSRDIIVKGGSNYLAERDGISIKGSMRVVVDDVSFEDNGQDTDDTYADIVLIEEAAISVTGITQTTGTATVTVADGDVPAIGTYITVSGANESEYNITGRVLTTPSDTTFTYAVDSGASSPATGTIIFDRPTYKCFIGDGCTYDAKQTNKVKYHVEETADTCDHNTFKLGSVDGAATADILVSGRNSVHRDAPQVETYVSSLYYFATKTAGSKGTKSLTAGRFYYVGPFTARETRTLTRLGIDVTTASATGGKKGIIGVYSDLNGVPDKLIGTGNVEIAIDAIAEVEATVVVPVIKGKRYWLALNIDEACTVASFANTNNVREAGVAFDTTTTIVKDTVAYATTLPDSSAAVAGDYTAESAPFLWYRIV